MTTKPIIYKILEKLTKTRKKILQKLKQGPQRVSKNLENKIASNKYRKDQLIYMKVQASK